MPKPQFGAKKRPSEKSYLEERLAAYISSRGLRPPVRQHRFHPTRKWTWDFCWPELGVALEIEGAIFVKGGHSSGVGIVRDCDKQNAAMALGWHLFRATSMHFRDGSVFTLVEQITAARPVYICEVLVAPMETK
jgi:hypothetical protein